jgi:2-polyprenyl-6-methoxyphenol hydroxylase-like FAD-dependent oxidoreductase
MMPAETIVIVGAGPVGSLAALYAAQRGYNVELYELRPGTYRTGLRNHQLLSSRARLVNDDSMCHGRIMFIA